MDARNPPIVADVVREHVEAAAFQWAQRDTLSQEDPVDTEALASVDRRLEANLDGIRIAGAAAWPFIIDAFETYPEKGELFVTTFLAIETGDRKRLDQAAAFAKVANDGSRGLCGAFEWLPPKVTAETVREWIDAVEEVKIEAALSAIVAHGGTLGNRLPDLLNHRSEQIRAIAQKFS